MKIDRVSIKNFRNFENVTVDLGQNVTLVGANATGKSNFIYALRLILDPALSHRDRMLTADDFWRGDGLEPWKGREIEISVGFSDFITDPNLAALLSSFTLKDRPEVAHLAFIYKPKGNIAVEQAGENSYEYDFYGGDPLTKYKKEILWSNFTLQVVDALRDASANISASRLPLRRLLNLYNINSQTMQPVLEHIKQADQVLQDNVSGVKSLEAAIQSRLKNLTEQIHDLDPMIRFLSGNAESLVKALRLLIEGGQPIDNTSLGLANVLFLTLALLDVEEREKVKQPKGDDEYHFTILGIEEPEAHLHPHLQRILFRDFVKRNPLILSTHSPHIASVCSLDSIVMFRKPDLIKGTEIRSTVKLKGKLSEQQYKDIQRYLDVTRAEILFARAVIFVEGDAEQFLLPELARQAGYDLDKHGITICSVGGTDFLPYVILAGSDGLGIPYAIITDGDKFARLDDAIAQAKTEKVWAKTECEEVSKLSPPEKRYRLESAGIPFYLGIKRGIELAKKVILAYFSHFTN